MLASRLPGILPPLSQEEAQASAAIHSISGQQRDWARWYQRPFRAPHHSASTVALVGDRLRRKTVAEWVAILTAAGVPNAPINPVETVLAFPHVADRGIVQPYQHPRYGALNSISIPLRTDGPVHILEQGPRALTL